MNPFVLDWGGVTPEIFDEKTNTAVHIVNHNLELKENIQRSINFLIVRIRWFNHHLPEGVLQKIIIDARGQGITYESLKKMKAAILSKLKNVEPTIEFRM